jgi:hypothetical protein
LNGGSDWVGGKAFSAGTFWNSCATSTKTLKYSAITAAITVAIDCFRANCVSLLNFEPDHSHEAERNAAGPSSPQERSRGNYVRQGICTLEIARSREY